MKQNDPIKINGTVVKGSGDGKKLGFPTINVEFTGVLNLEFGVYTTKVKIDNQIHMGVMHFGPRYVFGENNPKLEIHIFDFDQNVYGKNVTVEILDFIRPSIKFDSFEKLIDQVEQDKIDARKILKI